MPSPHQRIGRVAVHRLATARGHDGDFREEGVDLARLLVEHIRPETFDAGRVARHDDAQVVLGDDFDGEMVFEYRDVGVLFHRIDEAGLYLGPGIVFVVQDTELGVAALPMEVKLTVLFLVKLHAPLDELPDLTGSFAHHLLHSLPVAYPVAGNHRVFDMLLEVVNGHIGHRGDASLCKIGVGLFETGFADERHFAFVGHFQGKTHSRNARTDNQKIVFVYHTLFLSPDFVPAFYRQR